MADFGMGPYAWGKNIQDIDDSRVGGNIADSVSGFEPAYGVPGELQDRLGAWVAHFEKCADQPGFNWEEPKRASRATSNASRCFLFTLLLLHRRSR